MADDDISTTFHVEAGGFQKMLGYEFVHWDEGSATLEIEITDDHRNRDGRVHGGLIVTLLDAACTRAGVGDGETGEVRRAATVSMTTNFISFAEGGKLRVEGKKTGGGRRLFFAEAHAYTEDGTLIATGVATCRYASG